MHQLKIEAIVKGKVQKVGFRDHVQETARNLGVKGYVENMKDGTVRIICEAEQSVLEKFINQINIKTDLITVESIEVIKRQPATGEYQYFDIKYGPLEEEMGERLGAAFKIATATRQDIKEMHQDLKSSITSMHQDLKTSVTSMHQDLKTSVTSMHQDLKTSITSMHQDLKTSITSMHQDMNRHFEEMAKRYDAISAELLKTREELKRAVDSLVELIRKFLEKP